MDVTMVFTGLNLIVLVVILYLYGRIALRSRAVLSVGLIVFALLLMVQNVMTLYAFYTMAPLFGVETVPILLTASALQFSAYLVLLRFTL